MRSPLAALAGVLLVMALGACDLTSDPSSQTPAPRAPASSSDTPAPGGGSGGGSGGTASDACAEVVAGIDAFNAGDYDETVTHFEKAVPLAEDEDDGSPAAQDLIEAVKYYADLAPDDYLEASLSSPDFAKYKQITLGQCATGGAIEPPDDSGVDA